MRLSTWSGRSLVAVVVAVSALLLAGAPARAAEPPPDRPYFLECPGKPAGTLSLVKPVAPRTLVLGGAIVPCRKPDPNLRFGIAAYPRGDKIAPIAMPRFTSAPGHRFWYGVRLPVGATRVCLVRTPYGADVCYAVTVSQHGNPVVHGRTHTKDTALRHRDEFPWCGACW